MNSTTRIAALALGIYAGFLGIEHGIFEILQGNTAINGLMINAMGSACQPETVWHACFPALTLLPNYLATGILATIFGLSIMMWVTGFVHCKHGGVILILLSILIVMLGGGFVSAFIGIIAGAVGTRIHAPLIWWRRRSSKTISFLSKLWPWTLFLLIAWVPGSWILGYFFNQVLLNLSFVLFFCFDIGLPLLVVFSAFARDIHSCDGYFCHPQSFVLISGVFSLPCKPISEFSSQGKQTNREKASRESCAGLDSSIRFHGKSMPRNMEIGYHMVEF